MILSHTEQPTRASKRRADKLLTILLLPFAISLILLLFGTARSDAADSCLDNLPVPTPLLHRVVQLVNCSNQSVLGTANAAHVAGLPPTPVLPREKTWVMEPFPVPPGAPANSNVLTIDIPKEWEDTSPKGSTGPNFWVRTGCRYDVGNRARPMRDRRVLWLLRLQQGAARTAGGRDACRVDFLSGDDDRDEHVLPRPSRISVRSTA